MADMKIIGLVSSKGGVGKTTSAVNLAAIFAERARVLLVDADPAPSADWWLSRAEQDFDFTAETNPSIISRYPDANYDFIFVDSPPRPSTALQDAILEISDLAIVPAGAAPLDVQMAVRLVRTLDKPYRLLLCRVHPLSTREAVVLRDAMRKATIPTFTTIIRQLKAHERSVLAGVPVTKWQGAYASEAAGDYRKLAAEVRRWLGRQAKK